MGDCYILCGWSGVTWPLGCASPTMRAVPFLPQSVARRSDRRPLSSSVSGCRCHGCPSSRFRNRLFCVPLSSVRSCCRSISSLRRTLLSSWCKGEDVALALVLAGCYLGAVAPWFLAAFHWSCVVAVQALVLPGPVRLDISLLTNWRLALGPCFLVGSLTIRRHPMGCHGWRFVYVSTI